MDILAAVMKIRAAIHLFPPFALTQRGAKKGTDRFYAWLDDLAHLKRMV
ncbi:hypothetical protein bcere0022_31710 [Bacillus cereus Rock3-44]|nr:hypothetical protein bcere0022_31710 [Bacillus cereus Rock3-44]